MCIFLSTGMLRSLGILLAEVIIRFDSSSAMASLLFGLMYAGISLTGMLGEKVLLCQYYGDKCDT